MRTTRLATRVLAVGAAAVTVCGLGVVAGAATRSSGYVACADSHHHLSLLSHGKCASGTHKVSIGARGPRGATGKKGKPGTNGKPGATGKQGPSDLYAATGSVSLAHVSLLRSAHARPRSTPHLSPPATLTLPAGFYELNWSASVNLTKTISGTPDGHFVAMMLCAPYLTPNGATQPNQTLPGPDDEEHLSMHADANSGGMSTYNVKTSLTGLWAMTVPAGGGTVELACDAPVLRDGYGNQSAAGNQYASGDLLATQVGALHGANDHP